jgi:hypothetical protein
MSCIYSVLCDIEMICEDCDYVQHHCTCEHCEYEHIAHEVDEK